MSLNKGDIIGSRYQIIKELSSGGFAKTYLAEDTHLPSREKLIVKQLKPLSMEPSLLHEAKSRFKKEAEVLQKLGDNDLIPKLLAHFEEHGEFYLVQQLVDGDDLSKELTSNKRLSESEVIKLLEDILKVLEFVHDKDVIHRDIKPSNLIRRRQDQKIVLIDFGAVREIGVLKQTGLGQVSPTMSIGTEGYMPAEQRDGNPKFCSDIYAVGMIGIQALTGLNPKRIPSDPDTSEKIWRYRLLQVNPRLVAVLEKMIRYHFKDRYQSATEVLEALQAIPVPQRSPWLSGSVKFLLGLAVIVLLLVFLGRTRIAPVVQSFLTTFNFFSPIDKNIEISLSNTIKTNGKIEDFAMSPKDEILAVVGHHQDSDNFIVEIWNLKTRKREKAIPFYTEAYPYPSFLSSVVFSSDGKLLASSNHHQINIWNIDNWQLKNAVSGKTGLVYSIAFNPKDSNMFISGGGMSMNLWNVSYQKPLKTFNMLTNFHPQYFSQVAFSPDGKTVAMTFLATNVYILNRNNPEERLMSFVTFYREIQSIAFSPDGRFLAAACKAGDSNGAVTIWDLQTRNEVELDLGSYATSIAFSPDGNTLVSGYANGSIKLWDIGNPNSKQPLQELPAHRGRVVSVAFSPDGKTVISGSHDGSIKIWKVSRQ